MINKENLQQSLICFTLAVLIIMIIYVFFLYALTVLAQNAEVEL